MEDDNHKDSRIKNAGQKVATNLAKKQAKKLIVRAAATTAISTSWIWGPILIILFLVFIPIIYTLIPGPSQTNQFGLVPSPEASPSPSISPGAPTPTPPPIKRETPSCDQIDQRLGSDFQITMIGTTCENKQLGWSMYQHMFSAPAYVALFRRAGNKRITFLSGGCKAYTNAPNFRIWGPCSASSLRYLFIHEMGHVVGHFNSSLRYNFNLEALKVQDSNCYDGGFIKSYSIRSGVRPKSESFAESMYLYVVNSKRGYYSPREGFYGRAIYNFKQECPNTYRTMRDHFFGGYEFN